ncbi:MAG: altronate dehydratase [Chloroflexi bacterium]|nr:altronate dehydratase [Chloroflexota bacterium]
MTTCTQRTTHEQSASVQPIGSDIVSLHEVAVHLHPEDNVAIARLDLVVGLTLEATLPGEDARRIVVSQPIPGGHKVALKAIVRGAAVRRYGQIIGFATEDIEPGVHVHQHNLDAQDFSRDYAYGADVRPVQIVPESERRTFLGYRRPNGQVGTRNIVAVISSVNCSAHVAREIGRRFTPERLAAFPNVDGVISVTHPYGCSVRIGGADYDILQRTLAGMALHPNVGAYILVGLGCEVNQIPAMVENYDLCGFNGMLPGDAPQIVIQELGGTRKAIAAGIEAVEALLPQVNAAERTPAPVSELVIALQCGGSDGWSGITSNPAIGLVADEIVRQGGTVVLSETTEVYGAEHLLTRRAIRPKVGQKLVEQIRWWEEHARQMGMEIDNNPTPGNKVGGLTTIYEKSLGAIAKAGSTPLMDVYDYAERVTARGFTFMDGPGNDWTAVTGQVAGGSTLVIFSTGRGSVFGFTPAPVIKVASNSALYERMKDDMDLNAGRVQGGEALAAVANDLLELTIAVASGQPSKSEAQGIGEAEFSPWHLGGVL